MPQFNPVVLKDSALADHTFNPREISGGVALFVETSGVPIGEKKLTVMRDRTKQSSRERTVAKLVLPVVQDVVVAGISKPTAVRTAFVEVSFSFDPASSTLERADALAYMKNALSHASVTSIVKDLETFY